MANIRRAPRLCTVDGKQIKVSRWIEFNEHSPFANTVFEIASDELIPNLQDSSECVVETDEKSYLVKIKRFQEGESLRISGKITKQLATK